MPGAYFRLALRRFGQDPADAARILEGTGIDPEQALAAGQEDEITLGQQLLQVRNLSNLRGPGWGLEAGEALDAAAHGALGLAAASASTLREAISAIERFAYVRVPYFRLFSEAGSEYLALRVEPQLPLEPAEWRPLVETMLHSLQGFIESSLGAPMEMARFEVDYPDPGYADRYADSLHAPVAFDQGRTLVLVPNHWLSRPSPFADPALHRTALERLAADERHLRGDEYLVAQVERILAEVDSRNMNLAFVAARVHLSRRTLVRRLGRRGTSFRELLEHHRQKRARELLADPKLTVAEVGYRLGYADPANFGRACRRWFGRSPRAMRRLLEAGKD